MNSRIAHADVDSLQLLQSKTGRGNKIEQTITKNRKAAGSALSANTKKGMATDFVLSY